MTQESAMAMMASTSSRSAMRAAAVALRPAQRSLHGSAFVQATAPIPSGGGTDAAPYAHAAGSGFAPSTGPTRIVQPTRNGALFENSSIVAGGPQPVGRQPTSHYAVATPAPNYDLGPSAIDKASKFFFMTEIFRGMAVVMEQFFRPPFTIMYPSVRSPSRLV